MTTENKKAVANPAAILGGLAGFGLSRFLGAAVWIPLIASLLIAAGLRAFRTSKGKAFTAADGAVAVMGGHVIWMLAAGLLAGSFDEVLIDVVAMGVLVAVLVAFPRPLIFAATIGLSTIALFLTAPLILSDPAIMQPMLVHTMLRLAVITLVSVAWVQHARAKRDERPSVAGTGGPTTPASG